MIDHPYEPGQFGRCAVEGCGKRKAAHEPTVPPNAGFTPLPTLIGETRTPVTLKVKGGASYETAWPADWPPPATGQLVRIEGVLLRIRDSEFDLDSGRITLHCGR
jgi:hypothetical protein